MSVSASDVTTILGSTELSTSEVDTFISAAGTMYDDLTSGDSVAPDVRDDVVAWLAAHLIRSSPERAISSGSEGSGSVSFEGDHDKTPQWETAVTLDPTGKLASRDLPAASVGVPDAKGINDGDSS